MAEELVDGDICIYVAKTLDHDIKIQMSSKEEKKFFATEGARGMWRAPSRLVGNVY